MRIRFRECQLERGLKLVLHPRHGDKLLTESDRAESLLIEIVRDADLSDLQQFLVCPGAFRVGQIPDNNLELIAQIVLMGERPKRLAEVVEVKAVSVEIVARTILDRQELHCDGVPIFHAPKSNIARTELQLLTDDLDGGRGIDASFLEPIECKRAAGRLKVGDFFDKEIVSKSLDLGGHVVLSRGPVPNVHPLTSNAVRRLLWSMLVENTSQASDMHCRPGVMPVCVA